MPGKFVTLPIERRVKRGDAEKRDYTAGNVQRKDYSALNPF